MNDGYKFNQIVAPGREIAVFQITHHGGTETQRKSVAALFVVLCVSVVKARPASQAALANSAQVGHPRRPWGE